MLVRRIKVYRFRRILRVVNPRVACLSIRRLLIDDQQGRLYELVPLAL